MTVYEYNGGFFADGYPQVCAIVRIRRGLLRLPCGASWWTCHGYGCHLVHCFSTLFYGGSFVSSLKRMVCSISIWAGFNRDCAVRPVWLDGLPWDGQSRRSVLLDTRFIWSDHEKSLLIYLVVCFFLEVVLTRFPYHSGEWCAVFLT